MTIVSKQNPAIIDGEKDLPAHLQMFLPRSVLETNERAFTQEEKSMHDKSFAQAMQDVQKRVSHHVDEAALRMILHRVTATHATGDLQDENMRAVVTNELITGQIIALLGFLRDGGILDEAQYSEFTTYLRRSLVSQHLSVIDGRASA